MYQSSIISQILDLIYSMVTICIFDCVALQTSHWLSSVCWEEISRDPLCLLSVGHRSGRLFLVTTRSIQLKLNLNETVPSKGEGIPEHVLLVILSGKTGMGGWEMFCWFRLEWLRKGG